jgi:hypothetical protein
MRRRLPALLIVAALAAACGPEVNLTQTLDVTDVLTGWYDNGIVPCAGNPTVQCSGLLPSIMFRLKNKGTDEVNRVQLTVAYWRDGADGAYDEQLIQGIGPDYLKPGAATEPIQARAPHGFTLEGARSEFFDRSGFKDTTVKLFARKSGELFKIGEFKIDRRILPH